MKELIVIFIISLSLATIGEAKAETKSTAAKNAVANKAMEKKKVAKSHHDTEKKDEDCETTEEIKKKIQAKPIVEAPKELPKSDGFSLQGASTGCSL